MFEQEYQSDKILPFNIKHKKAMRAKQQEIYREYSQEFKEIRKAQTARLKQLLIDYEDEGYSETFDEIVSIVKSDSLMVSLNCRHDEEKGFTEFEPILAGNGNWYLAIYTDRDQCMKSDATDGFNIMHEAEMRDIVELLKDNDSLRGICLNPFDQAYCIIPITNFK